MGMMGDMTKTQKLLLADIIAMGGRCRREYGPTADVCLRSGWVALDGLYFTITDAGRAALATKPAKAVKPGRHAPLCRCVGCEKFRIHAGLGSL